jgi:TonB family protein
MKLVTVLRCFVAVAALFFDVALVYATPFNPAPALKLISIEINGKAAQQYGPVDIRVLLERKPTSRIFAIGDVVPRGMVFKTLPDTVAVFESINGSAIKLEPNTELFIDSMLADGREGYTLNFGGIRFNTPKPVTTIFVRYSNAVINAADAEFTIVGNTKVDIKEARINVLRGAVAIEESVAVMDVDNKSLGIAQETNFFVKGQSRITTNDREKRKEMKLNSEAVRHEFFLEQLKLVPAEISKMGKQIVLKNAAMLALRLKSTAEGLAKYQAWLEGDLIDWRAHFLLLQTFARDCAATKNHQCAFENYKAALDVANKLYPDGLDPDVVYTRFAVGIAEEKMLDKLPDKNVLSAFDKHTRQLRARMYDNVDFYPKRVGQYETRYPPSMQQWGLEGDGSLSVLIDADGKPQKVVVERSPHPAFEAAIVREMLRSKFEPATLEGKPVQITVSIPFVFSLKPLSEGQNQLQLATSN